ncbi:MAG: MBL fold metallo-hydrolase [Alphaproteobacteria bacterium]|nr:MBL fold metallo-hydrolase [Alphaproteobacteria bacterium]
MTDKIIILGSGAAPGVPTVSDSWGKCNPHNPKNRRGRAGVYLKIDDTQLIIDTSADIRNQLIDNSIHHVDGVLYTHAHADHIMGIDDLRAFTYNTHKILNIYAAKSHLTEIRKRFGYVFTDVSSSEITARPQLVSNIIEYEKAFNIGDIEVMPLEFVGHSVPTTGYCLNKGRVVLIPDYKIIPPQTLGYLQKINVNVLIMPLTTIEPTLYHAGIEIDFDYIRQIRPKAVYFTHLGPDCDYDAVMRKCLPFMQPAYDGLTIEL